MFSKGISASLVEATKKVMKDEESGLRMAAHAAHRQGKKMFHFQGKTYPITVKEDNVEIGEPLEEAEAPYKEKTPTGMRVYGSSYGNSAKAKRDQSRHAVDDVSGPSKKDMEKAHTEKNPEHYKDKNKDHTAKQYKKDSVQKYFSKVGEEVELDEKDELRGRIGTNIVNKKPREGQTDLRNIPVGNRPDSKNKFSQGERDSQPTRLKNDIKASLGKHTKPNLPEEMEVTESLKDAAKKILSKVGGGSDKDQLKRLQKNMGMPQTGEKPMKKEEVEELDEEQLDELSTHALNSYLHKGVSKFKQNAATMSPAEKQKKVAHLQKAHSKLKAKGGKFEEFEYGMNEEEEEDEMKHKMMMKKKMKKEAY